MKTKPHFQQLTPKQQREMERRRKAAKQLERQKRRSAIWKSYYEENDK